MRGIESIGVEGMGVDQAGTRSNGYDRSSPVSACLELGPGFAVVVASYKLSYGPFQTQPDRILQLPPELAALFLKASS